MASETKSESTVLVIDDDAEIRYSLDRVLTNGGHRVLAAESGTQGIEVAEKERPEVIFLDNRMTGISGIETLQHLRSAAPHSMVILMTAYGTTQTAIEAMKHGAFDYVLKPFDAKKIADLVEKALKAGNDIRGKEEKYERLLDTSDYADGIVGSGERMQEVLKTVGRVAASEATVMVTGESGTGKELVARCIHRHSHRVDAPFLPVNCAAIPENLIESELFGHEKGAFTGATNSKQGQFELCNGGTLFLDEVGDMALPTQTKILRAIQEGEIQRVGGTKTKKVDARLITATNKNLEAMVKKGDFREDLYYRLNVVRIETPPLRQRMEDLPELVDFMIQRLGDKEGINMSEISRDALAALARYDWPGNVRELENVILSAAVVCKGKRILVKDLPAILQPRTRPTDSANPKEWPAQAPPKEIPSPATPADKSGEKTTTFGAKVKPDPPDIKPVGDLDPTAPGGVSASEAFDLTYARTRASTDSNLLQRVECEMILRALHETGGNQVKASGILGITRATLRKRIDAYGIRF